MTGAITIGEDSVPRLAADVVFRFDEIRERWVILAPERVMMPDEIAVAVLQRCTGPAVARIVDDLAETYGADRGTVAGDVIAMLQDLADKGVIEA